MCILSTKLADSQNIICTQTYYPTDNTYVWYLESQESEYGPSNSTSYYEQPFLFAGAWSWDGIYGLGRSYINFDLSSFHSTVSTSIINADLKLFNSGAIEGNTNSHISNWQDNNYIFNRIISQWDERTITWDNQPVIDETTNILSPAIEGNPDDPGYENLSINLNNFIITNGRLISEFNGISWRSNSESPESVYRRSVFASTRNENQFLWPRLEIEYKFPEPIISFNGTNVFRVRNIEDLEKIFENIEYEWFINGELYTTNIVTATLSERYDIFLTIKIINNSGDICDYSLNKIFNYDDGCNIRVSKQFEAPKCHDERGTVVLGVSGGIPPYTIEWQDGNSSLIHNNIPANTPFRFTVSDYLNCGYTDFVSVDYNIPPEIIVRHEIQHLTCKGGDDGFIKLYISGGSPPYSVQWSNDKWGDTISNLTAGTYTAVIKDLNNCITTLDYTILDPENYLIVNSTTQDVACNGTRSGAILLKAFRGTPPYSYRIVSHNIIHGDPYLSNIPAGEYTAFVTDSKGCINESLIEIREPAKLVGKHYVDHPSCKGKHDGSIKIVAIGGTEPYTYSFGGTKSDESYIPNLSEGVYDVEISDSNNCKYHFGEIKLIDFPTDCIKIPTAFTPNGDGVNDTFIIQGIEDYPDAYIEIFNKWGQLIYSSRQSDSLVWDGKYKSKPVLTGTYMYFINLRNGQKYSGSISIMY